MTQKAYDNHMQVRQAERDNKWKENLVGLNKYSNREID